MFNNNYSSNVFYNYKNVFYKYILSVDEYVFNDIQILLNYKIPINAKNILLNIK